MGWFLCAGDPKKNKKIQPPTPTTGKTRARDVALNAVQSPLLDIDIERATGIVWNITMGNALTLNEVRRKIRTISWIYRNKLPLT